MRTPLGALIFISIMILLDAYVFQAIKAVSQTVFPKTRAVIYSIYWALSLLALIGFLLFIFTDPDFFPKKVRTYLFATIIGLFLAKFISIIFFLADDVRRVIQWAAGKLLFRNTEGADLGDEGISRSVFLSWLGLAAGGGLFGSLMYGLPINIIIKQNE